MRLIMVIPAALPFAVPAQAQFAGPRVALVGGLDRTDLAPGNGARDAAYGGIQIGYDVRRGPIVIGAEADIAITSADGDLGAFHSDIERFVTVAARIGVTPTPRTMLYAKGGFANVRLDYDSGDGFDGSGFVIGGGGELLVGRRLFLRGEYRYSDYGDTVRGQQFLAGLGVRF